MAINFVVGRKGVPMLNKFVAANYKEKFEMLLLEIITANTQAQIGNYRATIIQSTYHTTLVFLQIGSLKLST
jgi:hypothetical protein